MCLVSDSGDAGLWLIWEKVSRYSRPLVWGWGEWSTEDYQGLPNNPFSIYMVDLVDLVDLIY